MARRFPLLSAPGGWLTIVSALAIAVAAYGYAAPGNGIDHTGGARLVLISTILLLGAVVLINFVPHGARWANVLLTALIVLDILGTGFAAYMLEAYLLLALMVVAFVAWVAGLTMRADRSMTPMGATT